MDRATARRIAGDRHPYEDGALLVFATKGLVIGRRAVLAEVDAAIAGAARHGPAAREPELEALRAFVAGVLACARCDDEIAAEEMAAFAEVETDGGPRPAHVGCADAHDAARPRPRRPDARPSLTT